MDPVVLAQIAASKFLEVQRQTTNTDTYKLAEGLSQLAQAVKATAEQQKRIESALVQLLRSR